MKTTESPAPRAGTSGIVSRPLVVAAVATASLGLALTVLGAVVGGGAAALGALVGTTLAVVVFAFGSFAVDGVARLMPAASLLVALLTYVLQIVLLGVVFVGLQASGVLEESVDRRWLGGVVIACALAWSAAQFRATATARIPTYDLSPRRSAITPEFTPRPTTEGGDR